MGKMVKNIISFNNLADLLGVSRATVEAWVASGKIEVHIGEKNARFFYLDEISLFPEISAMMNSSWEKEMGVKPVRRFTTIELFAGAGGLALGMEKAGFSHIMLNELDHSACETLRKNRSGWNVVENDIHEIDFKPFYKKVDLLTGGFPCQAFSFAGKRLGFEETRGTLFFELARAVKESQPKVFVAENVKGLLEHDNGRTLQVIRDVIAELGYTLIEPRVLRALQYDVPQKRERLILIALRNDIAPFVKYEWPDVSDKFRTLRDAFYAGELFDCDVPSSKGQEYPESKRKVMELVPEGGDWRNLPPDVAKEYMKGSYNLGGGKTGMARRLSLDEASLTLTCAPAQKQTERCHPLETRPLTVREYARIQTFPDEWEFCGSLSAQYKQIGNAVPVNLAWAIGRSLIRLFNQMVDVAAFDAENVDSEYVACNKSHGLFEGMACESEDINEKREG